MTPIQQHQPNQQQTTPQAPVPQYPVLRLPSPAPNTMGQGSQQPLARCVSAPSHIDFNLHTPNLPTPPSAGAFNMGNISQNSTDQSVSAPASNEALKQFSQNMEAELTASQGSQGLDLPETIADITRVSAIKIKLEKRGESGKRIPNKPVSKAAADAEDESDSDDDSEDNLDKDTV